MKKIILQLIIFPMVVGLLICNGYAYTKISGADAYTMYQNNEELIVVDVRDEIEYCPGHIPCALHYSLNHGVFAEEFHNLPKTAPILLYCRSGHRSGQAAATLDNNGYEKVYSLDGGFRNWPGEKVTCDDIEECDSLSQLYFPHIVSNDDWETEIAIINTSAETSLSGMLKGYNDAGEQVGDTREIKLNPNGRYEIKVGATFSHPESVRYLIFSPSTDKVYAYLKYYDLPNKIKRVAIPALTETNQNDIFISHIAMANGWWTGLSLVNTTKTAKTITFTFNSYPAKTKSLTLAAGAHQAINLAEFLKGWQLDGINSAVISNAEGIIGLEVFGNNQQLSGVLLRDKTTKILRYPHITSDQDWWTGVVAYNPGTDSGTLTIKPYAKDGKPLTTTALPIGAKKRLAKAVSQMDLPAETRWLAIDSTIPVTGFELFGTSDNLQLGGYNCVDIDGESGVFPKLDKSGWTGIALVNTTPNPITVTMTAYADDGTQVAKSKSLPLAGFEKIVDQPKHIFDNELDRATYISYKATASVAAFQLNGNEAMLDALPGR